MKIQLSENSSAFFSVLLFDFHFSSKHSFLWIYCSIPKFKSGLVNPLVKAIDYEKLELLKALGLNMENGFQPYVLETIILLEISCFLKWLHNYWFSCSLLPCCEVCFFVNLPEVLLRTKLYFLPWMRNSLLSRIMQKKKANLTNLGAW